MPQKIATRLAVTRSTSIALLTMFVFVAMKLGTANGQEMMTVAVSDFNALCDRVAEHESRLAGYERNAPSHDCCYPCSTQPGIVFGMELLFLKPFQSEGESPAFDYQPTPRAWLGWTGGNGLGVRTRWFDYHNRNLANVGVPPLIEDFDLTVIDLEVTDKFKIGHWQGLVTGGVRYADYEEFGFFDGDEMNDGIGPVLGVELTRPVSGDWAIFVTARESFLYASHGLDNGAPVRDMTFNIAEMQLGVQWSRCRNGGGRWFVRGAMEGQYWSGGVIGDGDTEDLGLFGGTISVGLNR